MTCALLICVCCALLICFCLRIVKSYTSWLYK